jgi:hypothetical protein
MRQVHRCVFQLIVKHFKLLIGRVANDVDGVVLPALKNDILQSRFGIESFGIRFKITQAIKELFPDGEYTRLVTSTTADVSIVPFYSALLGDQTFSSSSFPEACSFSHVGCRGRLM